jgi:hypothetical protein
MGFDTTFADSANMLNLESRLEQLFVDNVVRFVMHVFNTNCLVNQ